MPKKQRIIHERYLDTIRACKTILRNLNHLDGQITPGQLNEAMRLLSRLHDSIQYFLLQQEDAGAIQGEE